MPVTRTTPRAMSPSGPSLLAALALLALPVAGAALAGQSDGEQGAIAYASTAPTDAVSRLQRDLDEGRTTLEFDPKHGYLPSVLSHLHVPVSSQGLVFSRTSLQVDHIAPWAPRAVYFNDDVYVGWVQGGPIMEVADADPKLGGVFYTLEQQPGEHPKFERQTADLPAVPRLVVDHGRRARLHPPLGASRSLRLRHHADRRGADDRSHADRPAVGRVVRDRDARRTAEHGQHLRAAAGARRGQRQAHARGRAGGLDRRRHRPQGPRQHEAVPRAPAATRWP